ncbi:hypothetical protein BDP81DRAFT_168154 [Colletotrichum phormii]|uniref:Uncharacterized protein n=1 Tax=Colletotrichum phormii TaxID=359342 RepID=A0AAI9ZEM2_9PEZI|nr:uncharacterized protein BDP81DRAFT_168154 [Colletotrichum phormii]KAK1621984.1 hypothetical protein BDP81DRAFT_168154 [Colletotrichum phormii]
MPLPTAPSSGSSILIQPKPRNGVRIRSTQLAFLKHCGTYVEKSLKHMRLFLVIIVPPRMVRQQLAPGEEEGQGKSLLLPPTCQLIFVVICQRPDPAFGSYPSFSTASPIIVTHHHRSRCQTTFTLRRSQSKSLSSSGTPNKLITALTTAI